MKVLHVNGAFSEGGVEQYLSQLFEEINKRGHQSLFLYSQDTVGCPSLPNVKTFYIKDITSVYCEDLNNKLKIVEKIIVIHGEKIIVSATMFGVQEIVMTLGV